MATPSTWPRDGQASAHDRILEVAYDLFSHRSTRAVGVDEVIERAGVAKATLYRHFPSKDDLVLAFLELRDTRWIEGFVEAEARRHGCTPEEHLLAIFDAYDGWFHLEDFEACSFVNVLLELGREHPWGVPASAISQRSVLSCARWQMKQASTTPSSLRGRGTF